MSEATRKKPHPLKGKGGLVMVGVVALLMIAFFFEQKAPPPRDPDTNPPVSEYAHLRSPEVARVELKREKDPFTLVKQGDQWSFEAPGRYRAGTAEVNDWLKSVLEDATVDRTVENKPGDLSAYGLDKPAAELIVSGRGGDAHTIQIGKPFQASGGAGPGVFYAREAKDGRLFMLGASQVESIRDKKFADLRDKRLAEIGEAKDVQKVSLVRPDGTTEVERRGEKWQMTQPYAASADRTSVETELIGQVKSSESESFADNAAADLAKYGLDKPQLIVRVTDQKGQHGVLFGKAEKDGKVYAVREGEKEVTLVAKSTFDSLNKKPADLRDRALTTLTRDKITIIELKNSRGTVKLVKTSNSAHPWQLVGADGKQKPAKGDQVDRVLDTITAPAAKHVQEGTKELAKYGLDQPSITVTANEGTGTSQILSIGKKLKETYYARGTQDAVFEVQPYVVSDLDVAPGAFEDTGKK